MLMLNASLISNSHCFSPSPTGRRPSRLTLIHLQDVNCVSNLQGELHILRGVVVIDRWKGEYTGEMVSVVGKIRDTEQHMRRLMNYLFNRQPSVSYFRVNHPLQSREHPPQPPRLACPSLSSTRQKLAGCLRHIVLETSGGDKTPMWSLSQGFLII